MMRRVISSVRTSFRSALESEAVSGSTVFAIIETEDFDPRPTRESSLAKASGNLSRESQTIET